MENILKLPKNIWRIIILITEIYSVYQTFFKNNNIIHMIEVNTNWLIISIAIAIIGIGMHYYWKISDKINDMNNKIIALKKFRDYESNEEQIYRSKVVAVLIDAFETHEWWKKGEPNKLSEIINTQLNKLIEEKVKEYNEVFKDFGKEYKREQ